MPAAGGAGAGTSATPASPGQDAHAPADGDGTATDPEAPTTESDDADADSTNDDADADGDDVDAEAAAAAAVGGGAAAAVLAMQLPKPPTTMSPAQGAKPGSTTTDADAGSQAPGSTSNDSGTGDAPGAPDAPASNTGDGSDGAADAAAPVNPPTKLTLQQILDALKAINPNFDPMDPKGEYSNNCGNTSSILNDVMNGAPVTEAPVGTLTTPEMEARTGLPQTAMTPQQVIDSLVAQGAGSHCVVGVDRSTGTGHWFNAFFDGTTVWTLDAQNGTMTPFPPHEPNATNWDASIHPDHVAPVPPAVDASAPDATAPAVDGDGSPKSGQTDATDATSREAGNRYVGSPTVTPGHPSDGSAGAGQTYNGYDIPELTPEIREQLDSLAAQDGSPIVRNEDGSYSLVQPIDVDAFNMQNQGHDWAEFQRQVGLQQQGLNHLTIAEWQHNSDFYTSNNRVAPNEQAAANAALAAAGVNMSGQAVLHGPDQVAGGRADRFDGAGSFGINSSLGNQWRFRIMDLQDGVRDAAHGIDPALHPHILLNVDLGATNVRDGGQVATQATLTTAQPVTSGPAGPVAATPSVATNTTVPATPETQATRGSSGSSAVDASASAAPGHTWSPEMGDPVLSGADDGPGWQRVPDSATSLIDPSYGDVRAPGESGALDDLYAHPGTVSAEIADLIADPEAPYGRDTDGTPFSRSEWEARYTDADGRAVYPGNDGGTEGSFVQYHDLDSFLADYGDQLDRMGGPWGDFLSFPGTPFEMRSLPPSNLRDPYSIYGMGSRMPQGVRIEVSEIAPAFGRDGGGMQVRILGADGKPMSVDQLVDERVLRRTDADGADGMYAHGTPAPAAEPGGSPETSSRGAVSPSPSATPEIAAPEDIAPEASVRQNVGQDDRVADPRDVDPTPESAESDASVTEVGDRLKLSDRQLLDADNQRYMVAFFDRTQSTEYYDGSSPTLGGPGRPFFVMPMADSGLVQNAGDAARYTGMSPATMRAYTGFEIDWSTNEPDLSQPIAPHLREIVGIAFPVDGANTPRVPTPSDARGWPHYLPGGQTAVRTGDGPADGFLRNPTREYVIDGGSPVPSGGFRFRLAEGGDWIVERVF